jgi:hypothetical protein
MYSHLLAEVERDRGSDVSLQDYSKSVNLVLDGL